MSHIGARLPLAIAAVFAALIIGQSVEHSTPALTAPAHAESLNTADALCVPGFEISTQCNDRKEPNDSAGTAKTLDGFTTISLTFYTEGSSVTDQDWYVVGLAANQVITLNAISSGGGLVNMSVAGFSQAGGTALGVTGGGGSSAFAVISNTSGAPQSYAFRVTNLANQYAVYQVQYSVAPIQPAGTLSDIFEVNDTPADALAPPNGGAVRSFLNVGNTFSTLYLPNFYDSAPLGSIRENGDVDWYFFYGRDGGHYRITTTAQSGVDTELFIFRDSAAIRAADHQNSDATGQIVFNDDYRPLDRGSRIEFTGDYTGLYWIKVWNIDPKPRGGAVGYNPSYNLAVQELANWRIFLPVITNN